MNVKKGSSNEDPFLCYEPMMHQLKMNKGNRF